MIERWRHTPGSGPNISGYGCGPEVNTGAGTGAAAGIFHAATAKRK